MTRDPGLRPACKDYEQQLIFHYYGEGEAAERERVERHMETCAACKEFYNDLGAVLPLTIRTDTPSEAFWESYSRELRQKLAAAKPRSYWRRLVSSLVVPWPVPAMATALTLFIAIGVTLTRDWWRKPDAPPPQAALLEMLPVAENLEFFTAMDILDSMDLIEESFAGKGAA